MNRIASCLAERCAGFLAMLAFDGRFASANWFETPLYLPFLTESRQRWEDQGYHDRVAGEKKKRKNCTMRAFEWRPKSKGKL
jgi:hypothetical protein